MKILVTGAAGAIGSHVCEALVASGHDVRGVDCFTPYYDRALKEINASAIEKVGVELGTLNLATDALDSLLKDVEVVYHFAAQPGIAAHVSFDDYVHNNIYATRKLLEAAKDAGTIKLFVYISTSSVYGSVASSDEHVEPRPTSVYGVTKLAAEQLALSYTREGNLPVTALRLFSVYGERERPDKLYHKLIKSVLEQTPFTLHEGSEFHIRSYTHVEDIVKGCLLVLHHSKKAIGEIFNLGTDHTITTGEGLALVEKLIGKNAILQHVPKRAGDQLETKANIEKARTVLGYSPSILPEEGLAREILWYKENVFGKI